MGGYYKTVSLKARRAECERRMAAHPDTLPVVVESPNGRVHFLSLGSAETVAQLEVAVRDAVAVSGEKLGIIVGGFSPAPGTSLADLYSLCRRDDGFLYVAFAGEAAMGARQICCTNTGSYLTDTLNNPNLMGGFM